MVPEKTKRLSVRPALWIAFGSFSVCALVCIGWGMHIYWNDIKLVNFLAAWIPFVLSILVAFVPEHNMTTAKKVFWRSSVILVGFIWSVVLWHQQVIVDKGNRDDQERIVNQAVGKSNEHSDQKIKSVQDDISGVKQDVGGLKTDLQQSTSLITNGMGRIGTPTPPALATLQFSVFQDNTPEAKLPLLTGTSNRDKDGNVSIDVFFMNNSSTVADSIDIFYAVCDQCSYAVEPVGLDRPKGLDEHMRHKFVPLINAGIGFEKTTLVVKVPALIPWFDLAFKYSCKTCGKIGAPQTVRVFLDGHIN